jgi:adenosylcobinamide kinase/adenosylcobinamide-phosphate guanylyltransferase
VSKLYKSGKEEIYKREKKFIFILGGIRSGKSHYAVKLAKSLSKKVVFVATATMVDKEMARRIKLHKISRPQYWKVVEENTDIDSVIVKLKPEFDVILIDCLGLLVSNFLCRGLSDGKIRKTLAALCNTLSKFKSKFTIILISNEVGSGVVPPNSLARRFSDIVGLANQMMAKKADEVIFMQAGIPIIIKSNTKNLEAKKRDEEFKRNNR